MFFKKAKIAIPILVVALSSANVMPIYASSLPIVECLDRYILA